MKAHKQIGFVEDAVYVRKIKRQLITNIGRIHGLDENAKKLCLCYMKDLLLKYIDKNQIENDEFFINIINLDFNRYLFYEKI